MTVSSCVTRLTGPSSSSESMVLLANSRRSTCGRYRRGGCMSRCRRDVVRRHSQSKANESARQISIALAADSCVTRLVSMDFGTVRKLSKVAAQRCVRPSSMSKTTSESMNRTVLVIGATTTPVSTSIAESRVITSTGRRPISSLSNHQTSPRLGVGIRFTTRSSPRLFLDEPNSIVAHLRCPRWRDRLRQPRCSMSFDPFSQCGLCEQRGEPFTDGFGTRSKPRRYLVVEAREQFVRQSNCDLRRVHTNKHTGERKVGSMPLGVADPFPNRYPLPVGLRSASIPRPSANKNQLRWPVVERIVQSVPGRMTPEELGSRPFAPERNLSLEAAAWINDLRDSGELRRRLDEIGAEDPELAS